MTITVNYKTDGDGWCYATTNINQNYLCAVDKDSFDIAREKLIERVKEAVKRTPIIIPEPEQVEVED